MEIDYCTPVDAGIVLKGSGITLRILSSDPRLLATCQEVLRSMEAADQAPENGLVHICLWDFEPNQTSGPALLADEKLFYLTPPAHLEALQARLPEAEGNILLKPLTPLVLRAFLGTASAGSRGLNATELGTLRANRDEILQHLLHANLRLQEYDQQRTNFIARAVHDFRAPLTALSGFCGLLAEGELGPLTAVQQEAIDRMRLSVRRISAMASAMFDLSTAPRLSRKLELREADILEPIRQALHEVTPVAREKQVDLRADAVVPPPTPLQFEAQQIEQVLVNLLDNACKFVPKKGFIEVRGYPYFLDRRKIWANTGAERRQQASMAPNCYRIDISDNGPGVRVNLLESIFEEYTSYSGAHDRSGGGLGLAICRWIVNRHGGCVWAESSPAGTTFSFVLPFRSSAVGANGKMAANK